MSPLRLLEIIAITNNLHLLLLIVLLATVLAQFHQSYVRARRLELLKVNGYGTFDLLGITAKETLVPAAVIGCVEMAAVLVAVWIYNGGHQMGAFALRIVLVHIVAILAYLLLSIALLLGRLGRPSSEILKGKVPSARLTLMASLTKILSMAVVTFALFAMVAQLTDAAAAKTSDERWADAQNWVSMRLSPNMSEADFQSSKGQFKSVAEEAESRHDLVLAYHPAEASSTGEPSSNSGRYLIVNKEYLDHNSDAARLFPNYSAARSDQAFISFPDSASDPEGLSRDYRELLGLQTDPVDQPFPYPLTVTGSHPRDMKLFDYGTNDDRTHAFSDDATVIYIPTPSKQLSGEFLVSALSTGNVMFTQEGEARSLIDAHRFGNYVHSVDKVTDSANSEKHDREVKNAVAIASALCGAVIVVFSDSILAMVYCRTHGRRIFVERTLGYRFGDSYAGFLTFDVLGGLVGACLAVWISPEVSSASLAVAALLLLASAATVLLLLRGYDRSAIAASLRRA